jgi:hypothetical protein
VLGTIHNIIIELPTTFAQQKILWLAADNMKTLQPTPLRSVVKPLPEGHWKPRIPPQPLHVSSTLQLAARPFDISLSSQTHRR